MGSFPTAFKIASSTKEITSQPADILVIPVYQEEAETKQPEFKGKKKNTENNNEKARLQWTNTLTKIDDAMAGYLGDTLEAEKFKGDCGKKRIFYPRPSDGIKAKWVVVLGLGTPGKLDMRKAVKAFMSGLKDTFGFNEVHHALVLLPVETPKVSLTQMSQSVVFAATQSTYKTQEAGEKKVHKLEQVSFILQKGQKLSLNDLDDARIMAQAESYTKDLANKPANLKTAECLAEAARDMASLAGISVEVLSDLKKIQKEMPAFWAVAQGAVKVDPPRFIKVTYLSPDTKKPKKKIALVGKGVIFDTGGVQVKTGNSMSDMKFDMTGAASVLAAIRAAAEMKLKGVQVTAYVAATKNLTGEDAFLPDSIIDSASGKRIEISHTDAEGRVTLADAVFKAAEDDPDEILTIATLTGTAGVAVGHGIALMGTNAALVDRVEKAAKSVGEPIQKLEFWEEDFDNIKSDRDAADLSNTGKGRSRGHMTAGAFVVSFAKDKPIAHLDIAGGDAKDGNATGIAVKALVEYLRKA